MINRANAEAVQYGSESLVRAPRSDRKDGGSATSGSLRPERPQLRIPAQRAGMSCARNEFYVQFSTRSFGTLENSAALFVTRVRSRQRAWAAIRVSRGPMGVPLRSSAARISP